jgi:hypothetical protein
MSDIEEGKGVPRESYEKALSQAAAIGTEVRELKKREKSASRTLDVLRRLTQLGIIIVVLLLGLVYFFAPHPPVLRQHRDPIFGALAAICIGYGVALELAKGKFSILLLMIMTGVGVFTFALGYVLCELKRTF